MSGHYRGVAILPDLLLGSLRGGDAPGAAALTALGVFLEEAAAERLRPVLFGRTLLRWSDSSAWAALIEAIAGRDVAVMPADHRGAPMGEAQDLLAILSVSGVATVGLSVPIGDGQTLAFAAARETRAPGLWLRGEDGEEAPLILRGEGGYGIREEGIACYLVWQREGGATGLIEHRPLDLEPLEEPQGEAHPDALIERLGGQASAFALALAEASGRGEHAGDDDGRGRLIDEIEQVLDGLGAEELLRAQVGELLEAAMASSD
ncbi:hypothetical protein J2T57_001335 [Natronocella acetinitrilica]|uniref:Uncharacterized protein n=1 Tax=Natronocella acetinitrilica TaxID=414046 RepID=A0AAE3G4H8_9GAMM|nr:hypothetical protein [Natronocella acetinitrilica]MCP1674233.1 hypothetical protein [Natronocella acetinitrilica]